uniref:(northern house mosquito) hypothetical protein n=1 Tax=Culex pipiens TaxID=7175 RepID=A0A8D8FLX4_CULPI
MPRRVHRYRAGREGQQDTPDRFAEPAAVHLPADFDRAHDLAVQASAGLVASRDRTGRHLRPHRGCHHPVRRHNDAHHARDGRPAAGRPLQPEPSTGHALVALPGQAGAG